MSEEDIPPLPGENASDVPPAEPLRRKAYVGQPAPAELNFAGIFDSSANPSEVCPHIASRSLDDPSVSAALHLSTFPVSQCCPSEDDKLHVLVLRL